MKTREQINALLIKRTEEISKSWGKDAMLHVNLAVTCGLEARALAEKIGCLEELDALGAFGLLPV